MLVNRTLFTTLRSVIAVRHVVQHDICYVHLWIIIREVFQLHLLNDSLHICYHIMFFIYSVAPSISPELMDQTRNEGDTASFTCQGAGEPVPTIIWYFNSAPVDEANTMKYTISIM